MWPLGQFEVHVGECSVLGGLVWPSIELDNNTSLGPRCLESGLLHVRRFKTSGKCKVSGPRCLILI